MIHTAKPISVQPRSLVALALLVLAALPWYPLLPLPVVLAAAVFVFLARASQNTRQYAMFSSVYAAAVVFLLPPYEFAVLFARLEPFFIALGLSYALGMALDGIQDGTPWAWLAPLVLLILMPSVLGLLAVIGLGILASLEKQQRFVGLNPYHLESKTLLGILGLLGFLAALTVFVPTPRAFQDPTGGLPISAAQPAQPKEPEKTGLQATSGLPSKALNTRRLEPNTSSLLDATTAVLYLGVVILLAFLLRSKLEQRKKTGQNSLWDLMPIVAVLILATVFLALALSAPNGGSNQNFSSSTPMNGSPPISELPPKVPREVLEPTQASSDRSWIPYVLAALALLVAYWLWRNLNKTFGIAPMLEPVAENNSSITTQSATNRVRLAYQGFLEIAQQKGVPRFEAETPLEFAWRYSQKFPQSQVAAITLTNLYEPVRYGQVAAETHAQQAEQAALNLKENHD